MANPGEAPLLVVGLLGFASAAASFLRRRALWLQGAGILALTGVGVVTQTSIKGQVGTELWLVFAGVGAILGSATLVTKGRVEQFFDDDSSPEATDRSLRNQYRALAAAAVPMAILGYLYRDLLR